jgi:predicted DNA-binding transcriptional regulator AlpA
MDLSAQDPHTWHLRCSVFANARSRERSTFPGMDTSTTRLVSRRELADLLSLRDVEGVVRQPDFPAAVRINARVCRWRLDEVEAWIESRKCPTVVPATVIARRRPRRRPA